MKNLNGKVAVITGATSGMGLETAKSLLAQGAKVVLTGRSREKLEKLDGQLQGSYLLLQADAASTADSKRLIAQTVDTFGKIDILFLNAGIFEALPIGSLTEDSYQRIFDINVKGPIFTVNEAVHALNDGASIIFNTSVTNVKGMPGVSVYGGSKAALRSVVRTLAAELAPRGIRVNAISPGPIDTPIWSKTNLEQEQLEGFAAGVSRQVPLGRFGQTREIADVVTFIASESASFITGVEIPVDGGMAQV